MNALSKKILLKPFDHFKGKDFENNHEYIFEIFFLKLFGLFRRLS